MTGLPAGYFVEVNLGGTWTDVSAYTAGSSLQIHVGRTSPFSVAQPSTLSGLRLNNADGRFTPKCQLLADGVTVNPNYPNIIPRAGIRCGYVISSVRYYDFYGYAQGWPPLSENGAQPYTMISAYDLGTILDGFTLKWNAAVQSILSDSPIALIPFTDPTGSTQWVEQVSGANAAVSNQGSSTVPVFVSGSVAAVPFADGLTGLSITGGSGATIGYGGWLTPTIPTPAALNTTWSLEAWLTFPELSGDFANGQILLESFTPTTFGSAILLRGAPTGGTPTAGTLSVTVQFSDNALQELNSSAVSVLDSQPHHYAVTGSDDGTTVTMKFYFDGALVSTNTGTGGNGTLHSDGNAFLSGSVVSSFLPTTNPSVVYGPIAVYGAALTATQVARHFNGGTGGLGQTTGARVQEYLRWAGVTTNLALNTGLETVGQHPVAGQTILKICQDMAATEGGGSVFYIDPDSGAATFLDRHYRSTTTPLFTVDAEADLDGPAYAPSFDALGIVNQSTLTRQGGATVSYTNETSVALNGIATDTSDSTVYCQTDQAALNLAQDRVASQSTPGFRINKLTIDLLTAMTSGLYQLVGVMKIGSRLRVQNLVAALQAPTTQADVYAEGWTKNIAIDTYTIAIDTTSADNPPRGVVSTMKAAPVAGNMTLSSTITAAATTVLIANSDGYYMTTTSASYPIYIQIGEEILELTGVPGGTTSPQTFTAVRGTKNSRAAPQTAGSIISLWSGYGKVQL